MLVLGLSEVEFLRKVVAKLIFELDLAFLMMFLFIPSIKQSFGIELFRGLDSAPFHKCLFCMSVLKIFLF